MASPSLHGVPRDGSPASAIIWDAPTPRRPSQLTSISSRADTIVSPLVRSLRSWATDRGPGDLGSGLLIRNFDGDVGVSQVPWKPWCPLSVLFDPGRIRQAEGTKSKLPDTAPACVHDEGSTRLSIFRGSITRPLTWLSTLRRMGHPTATQDSLLAAGPALPGGIRTHRVSSKGFRVRVSSSFPELS
jgi:hypothetical protein